MRSDEQLPSHLQSPRFLHTSRERREMTWPPSQHCCSRVHTTGAPARSGYNFACWGAPRGQNGLRHAAMIASPTRPLRTTAVMMSATDPYIQNARAYTLPRVHEASRRRSLAPDPLLLSMVPPSAPEAAHACNLCQGALSAHLAALEGGSYSPAPGRVLQPSAQTPLAVRGVLVDKYVDDELLFLVHAMRKHLLRTGGICQRIQIVDLGCGLGTRPWRLPLSSNVAWFDVDLPAVLEEKGRLLGAAGAETVPAEVHCDLRGGGSGMPMQMSGSGSAAAMQMSGGGGSSIMADGSNGTAAAARRAAFPLQTGRYAPVMCDFQEGSLPDALKAHGWDPRLPTIWVAFALLYYMDGRAVDALMKSVTAASSTAPCSAFVGTIMNAGMVEMIQEAAAAAAAAAGSPGQHSPGSPSTSDTDAADPGSSGSEDASTSMRRSKAVQAAATSMKFGVQRDVTTFLRGYGWEAVEDIPPAAVEQLYGVLGVAMEYPAELRHRIQAKHGHQPLCTVGVGRRGF